MAGTAAPEEDEGQHQKADHENDLGACKPELGLAVVFDGHEIESDNDNRHDGHPHRDVDVVGPVVDDQAGSRDFVGHEDAQGVPVQVAQGETHRSRDVSVAVVRHGTAVNGQVGRDFGHGCHDAVNQECHDAVSRENERRASFGKHRTTTDEETGMVWLAKSANFIWGLVHTQFRWFRPTRSSAHVCFSDHAEWWHIAHRVNRRRRWIPRPRPFGQSRIACDLRHPSTVEMWWAQYPSQGLRIPECSP